MGPKLLWNCIWIILTLRFKRDTFLNFLLFRSVRKSFRNKVHIFWEGHKNFAKSSLNFWLQYIRSKVRGRFRKILWPSQNIWTLAVTVTISNGNSSLECIWSHWTKDRHLQKSKLNSYYLIYTLVCSGLNVQRPTLVSFLWPLSFSFPKKIPLTAPALQPTISRREGNPWRKKG